jgi:hypothetical protein
MRWNASRFKTLSPAQAIAELSVQGLALCPPSGSCTFTHPMIAPILEEFLPSPPQSDAAAYYACTQCLSGGSFSSWDPAKFASAIDERIIFPATHATSIVENHPYLTRLYTRISPDEMTLDPVFKSHANLGDVALPGLATNRTLCDQKSVMELPTGEHVATGNSGAWPDFRDMPYAARIEDFSSGSSKPALVANNDSQIASSLSASNHTFGYGDTGCGCALENRGVPVHVPALIAAALSTLALRRRASLDLSNLGRTDRDRR